MNHVPVQHDRLPRVRRLVSSFALAASVAMAGCGLVDLPRVGDTLAGPFAVAGQPGTRNVFVLNSAYTGEYPTGSLMRYELDAAGTSLARKSTLEVPRLGNDLAVSPDGKLAAVSFNDGKPILRFYALDAAGNVSALPFVWNPGGGLAAQVQFFSPKSAKEGERFLFYVENPGIAASRTVVLKVTTTAVTRVLTLPTDLPDSAPEDYAFGFSAPAYERASGLLVAFPRGASGANPALPDPLAYAKDPTGKATPSWKKPETDLRYVSLVVVDFEAFLKKPDLVSQTAFLPLIYNNDAAGPNLKVDGKTAPNNTYGFRANYSAAVALNQTGCTDGLAAASLKGRLPVDAVFAVDNGTEEVLQFTGFAALKKELNDTARLPALAGVKHRDRRFSAETEKAFVRKLYSRKAGVESLDGVGSRITRLRVVQRGSECVPVWNRVEEGRNAPGNEVSRLQSNFNRVASSPILDAINGRGFTSLGVLSLGTGAQTRAFAFSTAYSFGAVAGFEYKPVTSGKPPTSVDHFVPLR